MLSNLGASLLLVLRASRVLKVSRYASYVRYGNFPRLEASPNPSMADEFIKISVKGLQKHQRITLYGSTKLSEEAEFESYAHYVADGDGNICLKQQESHGGTYTGIEPMGPLWSLIPSPRNKRKHETFNLREPSRPFILSLRLFDSFIPSLEEISLIEQPPLAETCITRWYACPGVTEQDIKVGRVRGYLFLPPGDGPFPGVISMSGGYPGAMKNKGSLLASYGFATLALKYFGTDDLPKDFRDTEFDFAYFEDAASFLRDHPSVSGENGVGIVANCYGASIALGLAACAPPGLIRCVVSVNGHFFAYGRFVYRDQIWQSPPDFRMEVTEGPEGSIRMLHTADSAVKPFSDELKCALFKFYDKLDISYLFIAGDDDKCIPMDIVVKSTKQLLDSAGHKNYQYLSYMGAGHLVNHAYSPHAKISWTIVNWFDYGGKQPGHERAQEDSWPKMIEFLNQCFSK